MTVELEQAVGEALARFNAVTARLEVSARFMERPVFMAQLECAIERAVIRSQSDWADRATAAAYSGISASALDDFANRGLIERQYAGTKPIFSKRSIDAALRSGALRTAPERKFKAA